MMKRRSFLKAAAAGLLVFPAAGSALAQTPFAPEDIKVPPRDQLLSTFGWVTDIHFSPSAASKTKTPSVFTLTPWPNSVRPLTCSTPEISTL